MHQSSRKFALKYTKYDEGRIATYSNNWFQDDTDIVTDDTDVVALIESGMGIAKECFDVSCLGLFREHIFDIDEDGLDWTVLYLSYH